MLGLFAEKDGFVTPQAREVEAAIKDAGKPFEIHIYPGVDHAFFNDETPGVRQGRRGRRLAAHLGVLPPEREVTAPRPFRHRGAGSPERALRHAGP